MSVPFGRFYRNDMTVTDADSIHRKFRFKAVVDTIKLEYRLSRPATKNQIRALTGGDVFAFFNDPSIQMSELEYRANRILDDDTKSLYFKVTVQNPKLLNLQEDLLSVTSAFGVRDCLVRRFDLAFDAYLVGRSKIAESDLESMTQPLLDLVTDSMVPLSSNHSWNIEKGYTAYAGHSTGNVIRAYFKYLDDDVLLEPSLRRGRIEISLCSVTLKTLGLFRFSDLYSFEWNSLIDRMKFKAKDRMISKLNAKAAYAVRSCCSRDWII